MDAPTAEIAAAIAEREQMKDVHSATLQQLLQYMKLSRSDEEMAALEQDLRARTKAHLKSDVSQKRNAAEALVAIKELDQLLASLYRQRAEAESRTEMATGVLGAFLQDDVQRVQVMKVAIYIFFKKWHQVTAELAYRSRASFSAAVAKELRNPLTVEEMPLLAGDCLLVKTAHPLLQGVPERAPLEARRHALLSRVKGVCDVPPNDHWSSVHDILVEARWAEYVAALTAPEALAASHQQHRS
jgi:signal transduction histidine kinase